MQIAELPTTVAPKTCAQTGQLQCAQVYFCSSENTGQNEDWPPIFILFLPDCLGRLLILGANYLVYNISFSRLLLLEANNLIQIILLSQLVF
jgi:hypothetical protein